jgi:hypothetical protein
MQLAKIVSTANLLQETSASLCISEIPPVEKDIEHYFTVKSAAKPKLIGGDHYPQNTPPKCHKKNDSYYTTS